MGTSSIPPCLIQSCVTDAHSRWSSALHCTRIEKGAGHHTEGRRTVSKPYFSLQADLGEIWEWRTFWSHCDESLEMFFFSSWRECVSETVQGKVDFELNLETQGWVYSSGFLVLTGHTVPWTTRGLFSSVWSHQLNWKVTVKSLVWECASSSLASAFVLVSRISVQIP